MLTQTISVRPGLSSASGCQVSVPRVVETFMEQYPPVIGVKTEKQNDETLEGAWEIEFCVVCKCPVDYCICDLIHTGGD